MKNNVGIGLGFGLEGEIISLTKYRKGWSDLFKVHGLDERYRTTNNYEMFCYMTYMCIDATAMFLERAEEIRKEEDELARKKELKKRKNKNGKV
jgi:hypothetical protein